MTKNKPKLRQMLCFGLFSMFLPMLKFDNCLVCPKGFEPPFSGIGIRCVIQLRHGQMYAAGYFACRFSFLIRIIFYLKINCKNCCATVFGLYYAVIIQQFFTLSKGNLSLLPTVRRSFCHTFEFFPNFVLLLLLFLQILEMF